METKIKKVNCLHILDALNNEEKKRHTIRSSMRIRLLKKPRSIVYLLGIFLLLASTTNAKANEYYVAKNGDDNNPGTEVEPWFTIGKAANTLIAGDTVYIKEGIYNEIVTVQNSGTEGNYIIFKGYPDHTVVLDGNGSCNWEGVFSVYGKSYIKLEDIEITNSGCYGNIGWGVLIQHDQNNKASTYIELLSLEIHHTGSEAIQVRGNANNIIIKNCEVHHGTKNSGIDIYQWDNGRPHHVTVATCNAYDFEGADGVGAGIASEQADNLIIEKNKCCNNRLGIDIGSGDNNVIKNNVIYDCNTGIALSSNEESEVYENIIYNIKDEAIYSYYWIAHGEDHARNKWYNNVIYNAGFGIYESSQRPGYEEGISSDHEFYNNLFYNIGTHGSYRVSFYFQGSKNIKFYNNTIYMNANHDAIQFFDGATGAGIKNNIVSINGSGNYALIMEDTSPTNANIDYNCWENRNGTQVISWYNGTTTTTYTESEINDDTFYNNTGQGQHSIADDPEFVNVNEGDFHLQAISPCIDAGDPAYPVPPGGGSRIDMGAFEYITDTTPPNPPTGLRIVY